MASARHINGFVQPTGEGGKSEYGIFPVPGLTRWDQGSFAGAARCFIERETGELFAVLGTQFVQFDVNGNPTPIAALSGTDRLFIAKNTAAPVKQIAILTQDGRYFIYGSAGWQQINTSWLTAPTVHNGICYVAGYFVLTTKAGQFFVSNINDGTTVNALQFASADSSPDALVRPFGTNNFLWLFGAETTEIWSVTGNLFPFSRTAQPLQTGILGLGFSLAQSANALIWTGHRGQVVMSAGGPPQRISTFAVEEQIAALTQAQQASIFGWTYWHGGHEVYSLGSDLWNWEYDLVTKIWHERRSNGSVSWLANGGIYFNKSHLVGSRLSGKLYMIDRANFTEDGQPLTMEVYTPDANAFPGGATFHQVEFDLIMGQGLPSTDPHVANPQMLLSWSEDGGARYFIERSASMGKTGKRKQTVTFNKLGSTREAGRIFRIAMSAGVKRGLIQARALVEATK